MARIVLYMWMSLDGFIAGPDDGPDRGLGIGGERLHDAIAISDDDPATGRSDDEVTAAVMAEAMRTGAVLTGRRTFDHANQWHGDHHDGVPIFVLTRSAPAEPPLGHARHLTDVVEAAALAREAAGDRDVLLHGASAAQACLRAGVLDELALQVVPVLLGAGRRLFDDLPPEHVELELLHSVDGPGTVHLRYRVLGKEPG
ncbi:dihydrofolate reductase family protein [Actinomycetospora endophytica]|uniref:Dihydrofolate reductase family protein n=1 Tax=Actinomycetospora endophytica TaxID=2291215 RepID=A0ABS8PHY1_9PSEU|nr:dihydrofolate reductase family protein [Actinomycetospora endophytica]MCD2197542.1 dihydrofolate reductase family protein [Actinomycetospora endophytica]